jgi:hypothetical protein
MRPLRDGVAAVPVLIRLAPPVVTRPSVVAVPIRCAPSASIHFALLACSIRRALVVAARVVSVRKDVAPVDAVAPA